MRPPTGALLDAPLLPTYGRAPVVIEHGSGCWLISDDGRRLLDFSSGVAVTNLGHRHAQVTAAAERQLHLVWHASNHYWTRPMAELASRLSQRFGGAEAFFCNSGAEAIEAAIKYARKATGRTGLVSMERSFHGRTGGALSLTGQPEKRTAFEPLIPGVRYARLNDPASLDDVLDESVACVFVEPIQGEGGIHPAVETFLSSAHDLAHQAGALLCLDEIQTGIGRTGSFFAFEQLGLRPDLVTLGKGLANGLPLGALLVSDAATGGFEVGDHATTFGGSPVPCAAACAVDQALTDELLERVRAVGQSLIERLSSSAAVLEVRGRGLMIGVELGIPVAPVVARLLERNLLAAAAGHTTLRLTPPLIISDEELESGLAILEDVLG